MLYRDFLLRLFLILFAVLAFAQAGYAQQVIYVKADATGANNGSSWQDAFTQLQPAIDAATAADQIWVAGGTYFPTQQRIAGVNRSRSFVIPGCQKRTADFWRLCGYRIAAFRAGEPAGTCEQALRGHGSKRWSA
ncbi:hypothetical protein CYPRO_2045 [Cyclonatronum proteinivorum]|uniref:DUF1565 domain-containing protein n=1 Tax=Cyclonatronum proteinivorum TaxID=1457365 RepID=A0A345ULE3_9BACT|nr:hypothetical protein [Cyclonatronum proteinivorum]AXJ01295.1 hypothetical protein CYPRO_2045 [Cyclonatronum proteinivorum]